MEHFEGSGQKLDMYSQCVVAYARLRSNFTATGTKISNCKNNYDVAHGIGVQNVVLPFFCIQEPIYNLLVIFFLF